MSALGDHPWWRAPWQHLHAAQSAGRLHHALLLQGREGLGKRAFARHLAQTLLCARATADGACGACERCALFRAGSHPDFFDLAPEEEGGSLKIDAIRALSEELTLTAQYQGHKVAILQQIDTLTEAAANSLLKTLEEPSEGVVMLLVTSRPGALLATIRSRCQKVPFVAPARAEALTWLAAQSVERAEHYLDLAHGAPLQALSLSQTQAWDEDVDAALKQLAKRQSTPVTLAEQWSSAAPLEVVMARLLYWLDQRIVAALAQTSTKARAQRYYALRDSWLKVYSDRSPGINPRATLERCLLDLLASVSDRGRG